MQSKKVTKKLKFCNQYIEMSSGSVTVFIAACFGSALIVRDRNRRKARDDIISLSSLL